jgi:hypothetical protein
VNEVLCEIDAIFYRKIWVNLGIVARNDKLRSINDPVEGAPNLKSDDIQQLSAPFTLLPNAFESHVRRPVTYLTFVGH